ncbi:MAG: lipoprotein-releasing system permease protein [Saprospiraceae bacterium]|jgi:lipoprotein-releasing system permease protein
MIKPLELFIGLRYTRAKRRNHFISFISLVSMLGIALGVWALITVLSVMNGFHNDLRDRILSVASHATVTGYDGSLADWQAVASLVGKNPEVLASAPYVFGQGMASLGGNVSGALIRGIDPELERDVSEVLDKVIVGNASGLQSGQFSILIGSSLAAQIGADLGDKITIIAPKGRVTPAGLLPRMKRFTVIGIFEMGMHQYDSALTVMHLDDAALFLSTKGKVSGLRLSLQDTFEAPRIRRDLLAQTSGNFRIRDWTQDNVSFFNALKVEKRVMFIILTLIIMVAAFNIVSTLVMLVTDKQSDIAILRTLGMAPAGIMKIFMVQGAVIGVIGTLLGALLGVLTAINVEAMVSFFEGVFGVQFFPPEVYFISGFPSEMRVPDVIGVVLLSLFLSFLATLYPAWRASKLEPAEALRYD